MLYMRIVALWSLVDYQYLCLAFNAAVTSGKVRLKCYSCNATANGATCEVSPQSSGNQDRMCPCRVQSKHTHDMLTVFTDWEGLTTVSLGLLAGASSLPKENHSIVSNMLNKPRLQHAPIGIACGI